MRWFQSLTPEQIFRPWMKSNESYSEDLVSGFLVSCTRARVSGELLTSLNVQFSIASSTSNRLQRTSQLSRSEPQLEAPPIRRYPIWLYRAQICSGNFCHRVVIRHFDGPDTRSSADIKDTVWLAQRSFMELVVPRQPHDLMVQVKSVSTSSN